MRVNHKRVMRIMAEDNLLAVRARAFVVTTNSNHEFEVHLNLAGRMKFDGDQSTVGGGHHLHPTEARVCVLGCSSGGLFAESSGVGIGQDVDGATAAHGAATSPRGEETRTGASAPFGSWPAVRIWRIRERVTRAPDDPQHESAGKSIRQCQLQEFHKDAEARGNLEAIAQPSVTRS